MTEVPTPSALATIPEIADIHLSAIHLAGLLHMMQQFDPIGTDDRGALNSGVAIAAERAKALADALEAVM